MEKYLNLSCCSLSELDLWVWLLCNSNSSIVARHNFPAQMITVNVNGNLPV